MQKSLLKPSVKLKKKSPKLAIYARVLSIIGAVLLIFYGLLGIVQFNFGSIFSIIIGAIVFIIEYDMVSIPFLKKALIRGIIYIVIALLTISGGFIGLVIVIAGILYVLYDVMS